VDKEENLSREMEEELPKVQAGSLPINFILVSKTPSTGIALMHGTNEL
jgi:hypothetical protein